MNREIHCVSVQMQNRLLITAISLKFTVNICLIYSFVYIII